MLDQKLTSAKIKFLHIQSFFKKPKQADFSPVRVYLLCIRCEISSHICHIFEDSVFWLQDPKLLLVFRVLWPAVSLLYFWMVSLNYVIPFFDCPYSQGVQCPLPLLDGGGLLAGSLWTFLCYDRLLLHATLSTHLPTELVVCYCLLWAYLFPWSSPAPINTVYNYRENHKIHFGNVVHREDEKKSEDIKYKKIKLKKYKKLSKTKGGEKRLGN